jgi:hypothetical protein
MTRESWEYTDGDTVVKYTYITDSERKKIEDLYNGTDPDIRYHLCYGGRGIVVYASERPDLGRFTVRLK